jgi:hypothetical protein
MRVTALLIAVAIALTGCAATPGTGGPSASPTPGIPTPSASASSPEAAASVISISGSGVEIFDAAEGITTTYPWDETGDVLVADLTALLGQEPSQSFFEGDNGHDVPRDMYSWDGIAVAVSGYQHPEGGYFFKPYVVVTASQSGTVEITSTTGLSVGEIFNPDLADDTWVDPETGLPRYFFESNPSYIADDDSETYSTVSVEVDANNSITELYAPFDLGATL